MTLYNDGSYLCPSRSTDSKSNDGLSATTGKEMITTIQANALHIPLPDRSIQCVVTSPPYWGLRDYGTAQWVGGDKTCDHRPGGESRVGKTTLGGGTATAGHKQEGYKGQCLKCGAVRLDAQIGLEPTPEEYVANMVAVFREVWRVLRDDGVLWLNLGDSYWGGKGQSGSGGAEFQQMRVATGVSFTSPAAHVGGNGKTRPQDGKHSIIKPKDMVGIPWRVAFALQSDGWYLRSDIIWSKPNPMPESVTDRPTKSHEYLFLLTKSERYYYDADAVKEPCASGPSDIKKMIEQKERIGGKNKTLVDPFAKASSTTNIGHKRGVGDPGGRNRRSVWEIATSPYPEAHFATFPPALVEPCILAGSRPDDLVLDPFAGTGTVGQVAALHGRHFVGIELKRDYIELARKRTHILPVMLPGM